MKTQKSGCLVSPGASILFPAQITAFPRMTSQITACDPASTCLGSSVKCLVASPRSSYSCQFSLGFKNSLPS